jgi:hypothetical protein
MSGILWEYEMCASVVQIVLIPCLLKFLSDLDQYEAIYFTIICHLQMKSISEIYWEIFIVLLGYEICEFSEKTNLEGMNRK